MKRGRLRAHASFLTTHSALLLAPDRVGHASGSPFAPVTLEGRTHVPGQGNNAYIFPGVGLGVIASQATHVTDEMFLVAAGTLASLVEPGDLEQGRVYPELARIRNVSAAIGAAVAEVAYRRGLSREIRPADVHQRVREHMYEPDYEAYG